MVNEIWKDIEGYEGLYQISNLGRIKSFKHNKNGKLLKQFNDCGYCRVILRKNNKNKHYQVHRLVAETFIPNIKMKLEVNHINGNKEDNKVDNLEWCTRRENEIHCWKTRKHKTSKIYQYDLYGNLIKTWDSIKEAQETLKINNISACCRGIRNMAGGFIWKYKSKYLLN